MSGNDQGTVDLFSRHVQNHEKHEWWLRDILEKRDGLADWISRKVNHDYTRPDEWICRA
jgi:hypothetical protein